MSVVAVTCKTAGRSGRGEQGVAGMFEEKRSGLRVRLEQDVVLNGDHLAPRVCSITDISADGVSVELDPAGLMRNSRVELTVYLRDGEESKEYRLRAHVAWVGEHAAGLHFDRMNVGAYSAILALMSSA